MKQLRAPLLRWYRRQRRDLPWRRTSDPYAIWVSEIMLQQTQVATVIPFYERFLARFPDIESLAAASEEEVLGHWSGLGYYRRARGLHRGAREVVERHGGQVPSDAAVLKKLPGIGRYTSGAIASIAFDRPEPALDGNVHRVFSRWMGRDDEKASWELATQLVQGPSPGDWNQALMELGATVCTPRSPSCGDCPVASGCKAHQLGTPENYPRPKARRATETVKVGVAWIERGGRLLLERPGDSSPLRGTWDLPACEVDGARQSAPALSDELTRRHDLEVTMNEAPVARATHGILHRRLRLETYRGSLRRGSVSRRPDLRWQDPSRLDEVAVSGATLKLARAIIAG